MEYKIELVSRLKLSTINFQLLTQSVSKPIPFHIPLTADLFESNRS